jgi:tetratricopeptide (TPR) repeat protein
MKTTLLRSMALALAAGATLGAQARPTPQHKHYERPAEFDQAADPGKPVAPRLQNLGTHVFPITTEIPRAQVFMNQGLNLAWAFNHAEAARSFAEVARLDPMNPMAYWGHALVLGPNINASMEAADEPKALELAKKAQSLASRATPRERAYISALTARYTGNPADRGKANRAFSDAMRSVVAAFPNDNDARAMFAESLMNLRPWNYWTPDGRPYAETQEAIASLEMVLKRHPKHPGALHLWIHLWEPTDTPERAEAEADRLLPLMPGAGHIVHMPAHIFQRVGRYDDVIKVNEMAAKADEDYIAQCRAQGLYPLGYYPHNLHFIWMCATASGQNALALESAYRLANAIPQ